MTESCPSALFVADALGVDFLNSIATPADTPVEFIASGEDLLTWLDAAGLVPEDIGEGFRKTAVPGELNAVAAQARALREWFRGFVHQHKGKPLPMSALDELAPLNRILSRDEEFGEIVARDHESRDGVLSGLMWVSKRRWRSPDALLLPIARSMAELICTDDFSHVKACEGHACTLMFVDRTRGHARRWCSMAVCGNRAKAQAHRDRAKETGKPQPRQQTLRG